jgi:hypothetical protein
MNKILNEKPQIEERPLTPADEIEAEHARQEEERAAQHQPVKVGELGGLEFYRCPCGFTLVKHGGRLYWVRARPADKPPGLGGGIRQLGSPAELVSALATRCRYWRRASLEAPASSSS